MAKVIPYLVLKKSHHWTSISIEWHLASPQDVNEAYEMGQEIFANGTNIDLFIASSPKLGTLLSLEVIDQFVDNAGFSKKEAIDYMGLLMRRIQCLINHDHSIGINFREVFLLQAGEEAPPHFRPGIDLCVNSLEIYQKEVSKYSYQLAKSIFNEYGQRPLSEISPVNVQNGVFAEQYANVMVQQKHHFGLGAPLNQLRSFSGILEANYILQPYRLMLPGSIDNARLHGYKCQKSQAKEGYEIVAFGPAVSGEDLVFFIQSQPKSNKELIIILRGHQYQCPIERKRLYDSLLGLKCLRIVQLILLTDENIEQSLIDLAPEKALSQEGFVELLHGAGYYLHSPKIFLAIYRQIQARRIPNLFEKRYKKAPLADGQAPIPATKYSTYVYGQAENDDFRTTKQFNRQALKAKVTLSLTQQVAQFQDIAATEEQSQQQTQQQTQAQTQQQLTEVAEQQQSQVIQGASYWASVVDIENFCNDLEVHAKTLLQQQRHEQAAFHTQHYHRVREAFWGRLVHDKVFRFNIAGRLFGVVVTTNDEDQVIITKLSNYSVGGIERSLGNGMLNDIAHLVDGLDPTSRGIEPFFFKGNCLTSLSYEHVRLHGDYSEWVSHISYLGLHSNSETHGYQSHLNYYVLLSEDVLVGLSTAAQAILIEQAESLLSLFNPQVSYEDATHLETYFFELIAIYFKDTPDYVRILKQFVSLFEVHHSDYLKIMIQIMISGHRAKMEEFLKLLTYLESRCLLDYFYKIYFKYGLRVSSVSALIDNIEHEGDTTYSDGIAITISNGSSGANPFVNLIARAPEVTTTDALPVFEKLCYHFLIFGAQHNIVILEDQIEALEQLWRRLYAKFFVYTGSSAAAEELMARLANNLIAPEGLSIAPLGLAKTLLVVLEQLIDHAISKGMLEEQIDELGGGLSFSWMDVPYAIAYNGFQVVASEMELQTGAMSPITKRYSVSSEELHQQLITGTAHLKQTIFRYLGTEKHREDLSFYREIFNKVTQNTQVKSPTMYVYEHLLGFFVGMTTGPRYTDHLEKSQFRDDFILFWQQKKSIEIIPEIVVDACIDAFFGAIQQTPRDVQKGTTSLWRLWAAKNPAMMNEFDDAIPSILTRKFEQRQLLRFIALNSESIHACTSFVKQGEDLVYALLRAHLGEQACANFIKTSISLLKQLYPVLGMNIFIRDIVKIDTFIERYTRLVQQGKGPVYLGFKAIFATASQQWNNIDMGLTLTELLVDGLAHGNTADIIEYYGDFLTTLAGRPTLLVNISTTAPMLALILEHSVAAQQGAAILPQCLALCEKLMQLCELEAIQTLDLLLSHLKRPEFAQFLECNPQFTAQQLSAIKNILQLTGDLSFSLPMIILGLKENPLQEFTEFRHELHGMQQEHIKPLFALCTFICQSGDNGLMVAFQQLKKLPLATLEALAHLKELHDIALQDLFTILSSPSILDSIAQFEREAYAQHLYRYAQDREDVKEKISKLRQKSHTGEDDLVLSHETQQVLLSDYDQLMSYMTETPVLTEEDGAGYLQMFTVHALNEQQFHMLFERLSHQIINEDHQHDYELMLLALGCEALYRTTKKFPRNTQIISVLNNLHQGGHLICEMKTGQGKSIVAALMSVLLCAGGRTVDVVTENDQLAKDGLNGFRRFYQYVGVSCGARIIEANSPYETYVENGINYSTVSSLALFRTQMRLEKKALPKNISLVGDEIDAALTTTVQYRLATSLNPLFRDTAAWSLIYTILLDFVKEEDIFLKNYCSKKEDIANFRNYFLLKCNKKAMSKFVADLEDSLLGELIESAMVAHELEENIDYMVVTRIKDKTVYYAAPILDSTKRPDAKVSFSDGLQQLLHARLNRSEHKRKYKFDIEPCGETLVVVSAKNFFDEYRLNGGRIIGFTGTAGTSIELNEFYHHNGLTAFSYPTYKPSLSIDLGLFWAFGPDAHRLKILEKITEFKIGHPTQPLLIFTPSAKATDELKAYLQRSSDWLIQSYNGYAGTGTSEEALIIKAGMDGMNTVANESLSRGTDIGPTHSAGLLVINTCMDITENDLLQMQGRAGRNGKPGQYCSIIDAQQLGTETSTLSEMTANFKIHRQRIAIGKQETRLKTRLLEDVRYHIVSHYFLRLRAYADKLLSPQFGLGHSLIDAQVFLHDLRDFNLRAERHYTEILNRHIPIDDAIKDEFLEARIADYQAVLKWWIPLRRFENINIIAPLIPLENLTALRTLSAVTTDQLIIMSACLSTAWKYVGHQQMQVNFSAVDQLIKSFDPYFDNECSVRCVLVDTLLQQGLIDIKTVHTTLANLEQQLLTLTGLFKSVAVIGRLIPVETIQTFLSDYFKVTQQQITDKKWDDLALPRVDFSAISRWMNRITTVMTVVSGPIPFMVKHILMPSITPWIKSLLYGSEVASLEILAGIGDITTDLSNALIALAALENPKTVLFGDILMALSPLLNNKAFLNIVSAVLSFNNLGHFKQYLQEIPALLKVLEPYKKRRLNQVLTIETMIYLFQQGSQFDVIKKMVDKTEFKDILPRLLDLNQDVMATLGHLSLNEFLGLVKVMAHPKFFDFIKTLPPQTTFSELQRWLNAEIGAVPDEVKFPLSELRHYQSNQERIEADTKQQILMLRHNFDLNPDKLKAGLARLRPPSPDISAPPVIEAPVVQKTPWLHYALMSVLVVLIIVFNVVSFSIGGLFMSLLVGWGGYSLMPNRAPSKPLPRLIPEERTAIELPVEPIHVRVSTRHHHLPSSEDVVSSSYAQHGFFGATKTAEVASAFKLYTHPPMPDKPQRDYPAAASSLG